MSIHFMLFSKYFLFITGPARARERSTRFITLWFMEYIFILFSLEIMSYVYRKKINNIFFLFFFFSCNFIWWKIAFTCLTIVIGIYLYLSFCRLTPNFETQCQNLGMKILFFLITLATWQHIIIFIFHYLHIFPYIIIFAHISLRV